MKNLTIFSFTLITALNLFSFSEMPHKEDNSSLAQITKYECTYTEIHFIDGTKYRYTYACNGMLIRIDEIEE